MRITTRLRPLDVTLRPRSVPVTSSLADQAANLIDKAWGTLMEAEEKSILMAEDMVKDQVTAIQSRLMSQQGVFDAEDVEGAGSSAAAALGTLASVLRDFEGAEELTAMATAAADAASANTDLLAPITAGYVRPRLAPSPSWTLTRWSCLSRAGAPAGQVHRRQDWCARP